IYRRVVARGDVAINPTAGIELPAVRGRRDRIASPREAAVLIEALGADDRALWATAMYAGLRRGELMALRWDDIDLTSGILRVERAYDPQAREFITPKSRAGVRRVPIAAVLRRHLVEHGRHTERAKGLVFGATATLPFDSGKANRQALNAWAAAS